jgi:iron complex outermembrane receptor protein
MNREGKMTFNQRRCAMLATTAATALMVAGSAWAQAAQSTAGGPVDEVVVTASRVARTGFAAPTPVTVIGVEQIQARAAVNVADVINESPAFRPSTTPQRSAIGGNFGANTVDLRGVNITVPGGAAAARTLVLVNGRRHVGSSINGEVDLNMIPTSLVERTEVVTGGASAEWGSDAVAGVVNLILKNKLQGIQGNLSYGTTDKADNNSYNASLAAGTAFAGGRGHVMFGAEYDMQNGLPIAQKARDWTAKLWGTLALATNPALRPAGLPANIIAPNFQYSQMTAGGYILNSPANGSLAGLTFLPGGGTVHFNQGLVAGQQELGGDNPNLSFATDLHVMNPIERGALFGRAEYDVTSHIHAFVELGAGNSNQRSNSAGHLGAQGTTLTIRNDNAFLPAAVRAAMAAQGLSSFTLQRFDSEIGRYKVHNQRATRRAVFGLNGDLGGGWNWDAYYQYGYSRSVAELFDKVTTANYLSAVDSVAGPGGAIVCRAQLPGSTPGCTPYNVFGVGAPSATALDYVTQSTYAATYLRQQVAAANIHGEPFSVWAGPVSVATGFEWRKETTKVKTDPYSNAKQYDFGNEQPVPSIPVAYNFNGQVFAPPGSPYNLAIPGGVGYDVKEVYAETVVPLAKDYSFVHSIDLNGAARRTDYSLSGAVTTWKFGATFEDSSRQLRLRGTRSRDIRAPNLSELYGTAAVGIASVNDTIRGTGALLTRVITSGSTSLVPEIADTFTYGAVVSPNFIPGFRMSADYYNIDIKGVIGTLGGQNIVDRCAAGVASLCALITRNSGGLITDVQNNQLNLNEFKTSGVDFEADYRVPINKVSVPGNLNIRALATYTAHLITVDPAGATDRVKQTQPQWVWNVGFNYDLGRFSTNLTARVLSRHTIDVTKVGPEDPGYNVALPNSINRNRDPAVLYLSLSAQYTLIDKGDRKLVLFGVVNNLTDRHPPGASGGNLTTGPLYDVVGRFIRTGVRFNY